ELANNTSAQDSTGVLAWSLGALDGGESATLWTLTTAVREGESFGDASDRLAAPLVGTSAELYARPASPSSGSPRVLSLLASADVEPGQPASLAWSVAGGEDCTLTGPGLDTT